MSIERLESCLLIEAVAGDRAALSELLLLHYDALARHIAARLSADRQHLAAVDDVLHQTFVRASQAITGFQPRHAGAFHAWLKTIADNLIRDAEKRRWRERRAPDAVAAAPSDGRSWVALIERIAAGGSSPSVRTRRSESARRVRSALAALPDDQRTVIELRYLHERSLEEIAVALGTTKDAVRGACYRARRRLRELMGHSSLYFSG